MYNYAGTAAKTATVTNPSTPASREELEEPVSLAAAPLATISGLKLAVEEGAGVTSEPLDNAIDEEELGT